MSTITEQRTRWLPARRSNPSVLVAAAMVLVAAVIVALVLAIRGDEEPPSPVVAAGPPAAEASFIVPEIGVSVAYPEGWSADRQDGAVRLRRDDETAVVAVDTPGPSRDAEEILGAAVARTKEEYEQFRRLGRRQIALSSLPAEAQTFLGVTDEGVRRRILLATAEGHRRAYLVSAFTAEEVDLFEVESILNSLSLTG